MRSLLWTHLVGWPKYRIRAFVHSFRPPRISDEPWLPKEVLDLLNDMLTAESVYLEYGSGGSTIFAMQRAGHVISVESDKYWLREVAKKSQGLPASFEPIYADIGVTKELGYPVLNRPTNRRLSKWRAYAAAPWQKDRGRVDVVLIDGRFRVACALKSLLSAPEGATFVVDDFANPDEDRGYDVIRPFIGDVVPLGTAVAFRRNRRFDREGAEMMMLKYAGQPR
jgi:hypothetical protein